METTGKTYEYDEALRARTEAYTDKDTGAISRNLLGKRIGVYYKAYAKRAGIPVPAALEEELKYAG